MPHGIDSVLILFGALAIDRVLGEYPTPIHPVVWLGQAITLFMKAAPRSGWWRQLFFGAILAVAICSLSVGLAWGALALARSVPYLDWLVAILLLKASLALRELDAAALRVQDALENGDLDGARTALRSLCSRDPSQLDRAELLGATIESVAENASDSFVAPLFYFLLFGVPGACGYRAINTLDAMIGYRGELEALGKVSARLDDLANWIPARLTAALLLLTGWMLRLNVTNGWRILRRDGGKTPSPNAGRPMAVMAGLLDVELVKKGVYVLGDAGTPLSEEKVTAARAVVRLAGALMALLCALAIALLPV